MDSELREILLDMKQDITDIKQDVAELKQDMVEVKQDVSELKQKVDSLDGFVRDESEMTRALMFKMEKDMEDIKNDTWYRKYGIRRK